MLDWMGVLGGKGTSIIIWKWLEIIENETIPTLLVKIEKCLIKLLLIGKWEQISSEKDVYIGTFI